ncbi:hypothetical protein AOLI_G00141060 [Acnodon oligacanthus]
MSARRCAATGRGVTCFTRCLERPGKQRRPRPVRVREDLYQSARSTRPDTGSGLCLTDSNESREESRNLFSCNETMLINRPTELATLPAARRGLWHGRLKLRSTAARLQT